MHIAEHCITDWESALKIVKILRAQDPNKQIFEIATQTALSKIDAGMQTYTKGLDRFTGRNGWCGGYIDGVWIGFVLKNNPEIVNRLMKNHVTWYPTRSSQEP